MKKAKIAFWIILFAFIALLLYQNRGFYLATHSLGINLIVADYRTPEIPNAVLFLSFFFAGLLISYFFSLFERFRSKKTIRNLTASLEQNEKVLAALRSEVDGLKSFKPSDAVPEASNAVEEKVSDAS